MRDKRLNHSMSSRERSFGVRLNECNICHAFPQGKLLLVDGSQRVQDTLFGFGEPSDTSHIFLTDPGRSFFERLEAGALPFFIV